MGKCGARELNYASDVDVIFVAAPPAVGGGGSSGITVDAALRTATQLASGLIRVCSQSTPEGALFPVDPNLRPEGRQGPLVRTLASHLAYYERWAKTWEFQALLKARPVAGDLALGQEYLAAITPLVWQAAQRDNFVADVQAMRRRVLDTLPAAQAGRQIKLGPGGLRDIEFAVQLLQLVHGRADETLREPATLPALAALAGRRLRGPRRRGQPGRRVPVPAPGRAPAPAAPAAPHPPAARGPGRAAPARPGAWRWPAAGILATRRTPCWPRGGSTPRRSGSCTRSCSTGRCWTRWPGCPATRPGSPRPRPGPGWRPSATPTRPGRCATSRR